MEPHKIVDGWRLAETEMQDLTIAHVHPASLESVKYVFDQPQGDDGRSEFVWLRLINGDLILGVFPHGETYMAVEEDAQYPGVL